MYHFVADQAPAAIVLSKEHQVPAHIAQYLKRFQVEAVCFLHTHLENREFCILNDESGLGKIVPVVVMLGAIARLKKCLIVVQNDEEIVSGWQFHFSVLTKLSIARLTDATAASTLHHNVYVAKWSTLGSLGDLSRFSFDIVVVDNRGQMLRNNFCTSMLLKQYEGRVNILISSVDVTSDLKMLHNVLRLGGGCLEGQYRNFKWFEQKFKLPNSKDVAGKKADLEEYFLKREKLSDFCRDFRLRRYCHQYEDVLPLVESERFKVNLELWQSNLPTVDSSQEVIIAQRNGSSDKGTEELFEEELVLNKELTDILHGRCFKQNTSGGVIDICDEPVVMSPLLLESESEEEVELQSSTKLKAGMDDDNVFEFVEISSESPETIESLRSNFLNLRKAHSSKLATAVPEQLTSQVKDNVVVQRQTMVNKGLHKYNKNATMQKKLKETDHRKKRQERKRRESERNSRFTSEASRVSGKSLRSNAEKKDKIIQTSISDHTAKRKPNARSNETSLPKRFRTESRNIVVNAPDKRINEKQTKKQNIINGNKRQRSPVDDNAMTLEIKKKHNAKAGATEMKNKTTKSKITIALRRVTRTNGNSHTQTKKSGDKKQEKLMKVIVEKKKGIINITTKKKENKKSVTAKHKQKNSGTSEMSVENKTNSKLVVYGKRQINTVERRNSSASIDTAKTARLFNNLVIKEEIVDKADDLQDGNTSAKPQNKRGRNYQKRSASILPSGVHTRDTRGMQRLTRSAPAKNKYMLTHLALVIDKKSESGSVLSRRNHRRSTAKSKSNLNKAYRQDTIPKKTIKNKKNFKRAKIVSQIRSAEKDHKPMSSQLSVLTGSSAYDDIQCGQKLVTDSGSTDNNARRDAPLNFLVPAAPQTSCSAQFPLFLSTSFLQETPEVSFVPDAGPKTQDVVVLTSSQDECSFSSQSSQSRRTRALKHKRIPAPKIAKSINRIAPTFSELLAKQTELRSKSPELFSNSLDGAFACIQPNFADNTKSGAFEGFKIFGSEVKQFQQQHALNATQRGVSKTNRDRSCLDILEKMFEPRLQQRIGTLSEAQPQRTITRRSKANSSTLPSLARYAIQVSDDRTNNNNNSRVDEDIFEITNNETFGSLMRLTANGDISPVQQPLRATQHNKITNYLIGSTQAPDEEQPDGCRTPNRRTQLLSITAVRKSPKSKATQATKLTKWFQKHSNGSSGSTSPEAGTSKQKKNTIGRAGRRSVAVKCRRLDLTSHRK